MIFIVLLCLQGNHATAQRSPASKRRCHSVLYIFCLFDSFLSRPPRAHSRFSVLANCTSAVATSFACNNTKVISDSSDTTRRHVNNIICAEFTSPKINFVGSSFSMFCKILGNFGRQTQSNISKQPFIRSVSSNPLTRVVFDNGIKRITLCNPKNRNALSMAMMDELVEHIKADQDNINLRTLIIAAEGHVFSAGHNLKELTPEQGKQQHEKVFKICYDLMTAIIDSPVPVIAQVDGLAAAAGCQLVAQCDIAVCTERSTFMTPGATFGIFCSTPGVALARSVSKMTAMHMLLTGLPISSAEAKQSGLVSKVCAEGALEAEVESICKAIASKSRAVIELGKRFYYKQIEEDVKTAYRLGCDQMVDNLALKDGQEGIKSFVEKRKAVWTHTFNK